MLDNLCTIVYSIRVNQMDTMTTLEAAEQFGSFTRKQAQAFCKEHDVSFHEAEAELGDSVLDCVELCQWLGY